MPRLPYLDVSDLPVEHRDVLARPINLNRVLAHAPAAQRALAHVAQWIRSDLKLSPRLREMALIQVGVCLRNEYEYAHHVKIGLDAGLGASDVRAIGVESEGGETRLPEIERTMLRFTRDLCAGGAVSDDDYSLLLDHLGAERLTELCVTVCFYVGLSTFLAAMQIENEPEYEIFLSTYPLPEAGGRTGTSPRHHETRSSNGS